MHVRVHDERTSERPVTPAPGAQAHGTHAGCAAASTSHGVSPHERFGGQPARAVNELGGALVFFVAMETNSWHIVAVATSSKFSTARQEAASRLIGKLMNIGALIETESNRLLSPHGLNHQQFSVLFEISRAGRVQQKDVTNRLLLERAHVSKVVKKLEDMGLVELAPHAEDGRSAWLSVSERGLSLVQVCRGLFETRKRAWFRGFDTPQLQKLLSSVSAIQTALLENSEAPS
jgi:DNA-binding MarR family transcriptional regulator